MQAAHAPPLVVSFSDAPPATDLEREWRALETRADASFFTSWTWVGCWLRSLPAQLRPQLARVTQGATTVGLALFTPRSQRRHGILHARSLFLHATGDPACDVITVEYNGILAEPGLREPVAQAVVSHLLQRGSAWEELYFESLAQALPAPSGDLLLTRRERSSYHVDLEKVRSHRDGYLGLLGQKPRYSVRRSLKGCGQHGDVVLEVADTPERAREFLEGLKALHNAHWLARGDEGAFSSAFAKRFHDLLVQQGFASGEVQLLHARAGDQTVGYLYNFVHRARVLTYQAGINYALLPPSDSPGLATHALAVEYNAAQGHSIYDFMVGDQQYKRALSTDTATQHWLVVRRDLLKFRVEEALRQLRRRLKPGTLKEAQA